MKGKLLFFLLVFQFSFSQVINVDVTTYNVPQLVREKLFNLPPGVTSNSCTGSISNITWSTGTNFGSENGIGYFTNSNVNFPLSAGVILSTGSAIEASGPNTSIQSNGDWPGDTELFNYIDGLGIDPGLIDYNNATLLEFDFVPYNNILEFNYFFASEEYPEFVGSAFNDVFGFFLSGPGIKNKKNLAIFTSDWHFRDTKPRCRIDDYLIAQADKLNQINLLQKESPIV